MQESKWWEKSYINHRDWILDHYESFNLSSEEGLIILMIDFLNVNGTEITLESLSKKCNLSVDKTDQIINILCQKKYLSVKIIDGKVKFDLSCFFDSEGERRVQPINQDIFELFESEFTRPLTNSELQRLGEWLMEYDEKMIIYALRESVLYKKLNFNYINQILINWKLNKVTLETLERDYENE